MSIKTSADLNYALRDIVNVVESAWEEAEELKNYVKELEGQVADLIEDKASLAAQLEDLEERTQNER